MPIGGQQITDRPHTFAAPNAAGSFTGAPLRLPSGHGPWTYMVNPAKLICRNGRIIPAPGKCWHDTGFGSNLPRDLGAGLQQDLRRAGGWLPIDHDRPVVAFGEEITMPAPSTYLREWHGINGAGRSTTYWTDAWSRAEQIGHVLHWDHDAEGRDDWLEGCLDIVAPLGLSESQIEMAIRPIVRSCRNMLDREDRRGRRMLLTRVRHIPADRVPYDLADHYAEAIERIPKPESKAATKATATATKGSRSKQ